MWALLLLTVYSCLGATPAVQPKHPESAFALTPTDDATLLEAPATNGVGGPTQTAAPVHVAAGRTVSPPTAGSEPGSASLPGPPLRDPLQSTGTVASVSVAAQAATAMTGYTDLWLTNALVSGAARSNSLSGTPLEAPPGIQQQRLEQARKLRRERQPREAEAALVGLLEATSPPPIQQQALLEIGLAAQDQGELPRAQQIYAQFVNRWPDAGLLPEVLLRQGRLFRQMGLNNLALAKFYGVMTSSLVLKKGTLDYYQRLVLLAQTEIAETHFQLGRYAEASDFFSRLLKQNNPALNRASTQFRLVRSLASLQKYEETLAQGLDFLSRFETSPERPEVRFHLAMALKQRGQNSEALQQVLSLLQEQQPGAAANPASWAYWQQRAGNEIGNQFYREGDYTKALAIYLAVAKLDTRAEWQLPVVYQVGLVYERLAQPEKALESYQSILQHESELGTTPPPALSTIMEMARWRAGFVLWQTKAENRSRAQKLPEAGLSAGGDSPTRGGISEESRSQAAVPSPPPSDSPTPGSAPEEHRSQPPTPLPLSSKDAPQSPNS